ncbi:MAG: AbrB/MazE/SpoVT family DNA-binding domain-containing protein [Ruminococcaceae bacterium]|nr:AbrB/MazE/SpoVT family DNA-binding domain-containing protein [Oscillospiraceae bacterium]
MKATGIVRRIDDLGRVVIPKEIRRTMRIREGDPLEIYTDNDGEVIFKKYSPIGELSPYSGQYADVLCKNSGFPSLICDRDHVVAAAGVSRKEYLDRRISHELEDMMEGRRSFAAKSSADGYIQPVEGLDRKAVVMFPVIASGDIVGAVVLLESDSGSFPRDTEVKLAQVAAGFLGKQMEE